MFIHICRYVLWHLPGMDIFKSIIRSMTGICRCKKKKTPSALFSPSIPLDLRPFAIKFGQFSGYEYISNVLFYLFFSMARKIRLNPIPFSIFFVL